ncbi:MAG TPA: hypothetical protein DCZ91_26175 [Lachnospiraceae bacterium]|nr:hypothetical protein [Lachnospiraceae bacterium]
MPPIYSLASVPLSARLQAENFRSYFRMSAQWARGAEGMRFLSGFITTKATSDSIITEYLFDCTIFCNFGKDWRYLERVVKIDKDFVLVL